MKKSHTLHALRNSGFKKGCTGSVEDSGITMDLNQIFRSPKMNSPTILVA